MHSGRAKRASSLRPRARKVGIGAGNVRSGGEFHRAIVIGAKTVFRPLSEESFGVGAAQFSEDRDRPDAAAFDWNQARAFLVTAEEGSLSAAARALARPAWQRTLSLCAERQGVSVADIG